MTRLADSAYPHRLPAFFCRLCCPARGNLSRQSAATVATLSGACYNFGYYLLHKGITLIYLCSADDTAGRQCISAPPASLFLSLMLPRKGQPFPPERRNCSHTFRGVLQFRLLSAPQRYNTLDFPRKVVCHETAGFFGFFRSKGNTIPSEHPRQRRTLFPFGIPLSTGMLLAPIG